MLLLCMKVLVPQLCLTPCDSMDGILPGFSTHGISSQEYWSGLPLPSPGDIPDPGIELVSPVSPALAGGFFTEPPGKPHMTPQFYNEVSAQEKLKHMSKTCTHMFLALLFITVERQKQPRCLSADEWINKCGISIYP